MGEHRPMPRRLLLLTLVGAVVLALTAVLVFRGGRRTPDGPPAEIASFASPYRNTRPGVQYVGDAACADCHPTQAETYRQHPMGRSFFPVAQSDPIERYDAAAHDPIEALGFLFTAERRPDEMIHRAVRRDAAGLAVTTAETHVQYVMGSGRRGRSYLADRDGYLFQSPVSWFSQKHAWDLSPKFETFYPPERVIEPSCLFCHVNQAEWVEGSRNHYRAPVIRGYTIGCERCHGPGELHVAGRQRGDAVPEAGDDTIVNPRRLDRVLREEVCEQCHLQGEKRVLRYGHGPFDFRPGLPLHEFEAIFVRAPEFAEGQKAVGQVEQMHASRCFQGSGGKLGCTSCHDPHALPAESERVAYYRGRCLSCHEEVPGARALAGRVRGCSLLVEVRRERAEGDSCMACHLPRKQTSNIAHTAITDHRVLRDPDRADAASTPARRPQRGEVPIVNFHRDDLAPDDPGSSRDLAAALMYLASESPPLREYAGPLALTLLEEPLRRRSDDAVGWEAKGFAHSLQGDKEAALAAFATALRVAPERETTLALAAALTERMGRPEEAIAYLRRLIVVNPWIADYPYNLARLLAQRGDWAEASPVAEAALRLNPASEPARTLLVSCYLRTGKKNLAEREFQKLLALNPGQEKVLRDWFAGQSP